MSNTSEVTDLSKLPKIYSNCKAGCLWETIHREEFERSAYRVKMRLEEQGYLLVYPGMAVLVKNENAKGEWGFTVESYYTNNDIGEIISHSLTLPAFDKYADGLKIKFLGIEESVLNEMISYSLVCEVNGERKSVIIETGSGGSIPMYNITLKIDGVTAAWRINEYAYLEARDGEDGHTPVRGIDYWTEDDKTEIVNAVLSNLSLSYAEEGAY